MTTIPLTLNKVTVYGRLRLALPGCTGKGEQKRQAGRANVQGDAQRQLLKSLLLGKEMQDTWWEKKNRINNPDHHCLVKG